MSKLLVTAIDDGVLNVDTVTKKFDIYGFDNEIYGACKYGEYYVIAENFVGVKILNKKFEVIDVISIESNGLHDVKNIGNNLLVIDSNSNSIIQIDKEMKIKDEIFLFKYNPYDNFHINCINYYGESIYLSMFKFVISELIVNSKINESEKEKFINIEKNYRDKCYKSDIGMGAIIKMNFETMALEDIIAHSLKQPHSLCFVNDNLVFAESLMSRLISVKNGKTIQFSSGHYTRGLACDDKYLYVGGSMSRKNNSKFRGTTPIIILDKKTFKFIDVIRIPVKYIYDIVVIDS